MPQIHPSARRLLQSRLNTTSDNSSAQNRLWEAELLRRRALAVDELSHGDTHPSTARDLCNLAGLLAGTNRVAEAAPLMWRALVIFVETLGTEHPKSQGVSQLLAAIRQAMTDEDRELAVGWSVNDVLRRLDEQYRAEGRPAIYFLPADQPISPHLDELLGPCASVEETLAELDRQYEQDNKPPIWFLPLDEPISPRLDALLGPIDQAPGQSEEQPGRDGEGF
jgi:hypothetical protein